ncbi:podocalyxin isoform X1 [Python bivittatus]|uniref:Podocalyxin n=1 Tax=Python bivittatus TaxID=176946 RepID=A0A9F2N8L7_PYTBI|nr:podocalyxin isoform X1 [Python bivittatus]
MAPPSATITAPINTTATKLPATPGTLSSHNLTTLPASPAPLSLTLTGSSKMPTVGASLSTTRPLLTGHGALTTTITTVADKATSWTPAPVPPTNASSPGGAASKGLTSASGPSTLSLSPTSPLPLRPVTSTAESPGSPSVNGSASAVPGIGSPAATLGTVATAKAGTTSNGKLSAAPEISKMPNGSLTTTMPKTTGVPRSSTAPSSSSSVTAHPGSKILPSAASTATSVPGEDHVPSPSSGADVTSVHVQKKIVCENVMPYKSHAIILTLNESRPCKSLEGSTLKETLMEVLCRAVKPNFNQSRDKCTVRLASDKEDPKKLAIIGVSVQTNSVDKELSEALAAKKTELEKLGVNNITHGGQPLDAEPTDHLSLPLIITIICMAASLLLVAAVYGCCHQRISQRKDQQRLTEELHTIENGYHDNPTLEVMETLSEMQEKKVNLNGELGDSWIVPMDSLTKEDLDEEEDTHL